MGVNNPQVANLVREIAVNMGQDPRQVDLPGPIMFSEDFAYFLQQVPGCYFGFGSGDIKSLHDPGYDFNDAALVPGVSFWARVVESALPVQ